MKIHKHFKPMGAQENPNPPSDLKMSTGTFTPIVLSARNL